MVVLGVHCPSLYSYCCLYREKLRLSVTVSVSDSKGIFWQGLNFILVSITIQGTYLSTFGPTYCQPSTHAMK